MSAISDRAAKIMKIIALARLPGMDLVAVKLNCEATYEERQRALEWEAAFELAHRDFPITPERLADEMSRSAPTEPGEN